VKKKKKGGGTDIPHREKSDGGSKSCPPLAVIGKKTRKKTQAIRSKKETLEIKEETKRRQTKQRGKSVTGRVPDPSAGRNWETRGPKGERLFVGGKGKTEGGSEVELGGNVLPILGKQIKKGVSHGNKKRRGTT